MLFCDSTTVYEPVGLKFPTAVARKSMGALDRNAIYFGENTTFQRTISLSLGFSLLQLVSCLAYPLTLKMEAKCYPQYWALSELLGIKPRGLCSLYVSMYVK
jgi:hypothetical protein